MSTSYLIKYSGEAEARDKQKNPTKTMQIKILDCFASLMTENFREAATKFSSLNIVDNEVLKQYMTPIEVGYYTALTALYSLNRKEMKDQILGSSNFKNIMEQEPLTSDVIENFLNGRYPEF